MPTVVLVERGKYVTTGARGEFRFDSVPEGRYSLGLMHAVLDSFDLVVPLVPISVANGQVTEILLTTPSARTAHTLGCASGLAQRLRTRPLYSHSCSADGSAKVSRDVLTSTRAEMHSHAETRSPSIRGACSHWRPLQ